MTELEILERAKMYIDKMSNGINPITDEMVSDEDTLNNVRVSRCLFYVSKVLENVINHGIKTPSKGKKAAFSITADEIEKFQYTDYPVYISTITTQLNALNSKENSKKISSGIIIEWLISIGLLEMKEDPIGVLKKQPTDEGIQMGIIAEKRISAQGTPYIALSYNKAMQHFIIDNIQEIINKTDELKLQKRQSRIERQQSVAINAGTPWDQEQEDQLVKLFNEQKSIQEIAENMQRTSNSISARLKKLGLIA